MLGRVENLVLDLKGIHAAKFLLASAVDQILHVLAEALEDCALVRNTAMGSHEIREALIEKIGSIINNTIQ